MPEQGIDGSDGTPAPSRTFERWGVAVYLASTALLVVAVLVWLQGTFVYVIDDPAIHLGMADTLVHHGTWGVSAGHFQSASSSPLWTLLVAGGIALVPNATADEWVPLLLNVAAGVGVVVVLGRNQAVLAPGRGRAGVAHAAAVTVLVVVALFLPGLALIGMEHTLHMLLVLAAVAAVAVDRRPGRLAYGLLTLAALTRFETAFVAVGLACGLACADAGGIRESVRRRWRTIAGVLAAVAVPIAAFAVWNKAMGGGFLPNSVLAKGQGVGVSSTATGMAPDEITARLRRDPLVVAQLTVALAYVMLTWGRPGRHRLVAVTLVVATMLHVTFADVGWHERYQAYLVALGLFFVLRLVADVPDDMRARAVAAAVVVALALTGIKAMFLLRTAWSTDNIIRHQYAAGQFLARYYDGRPIATDQLGYISWFHDGPLTDMAGLGDYEVLVRVPGDRAGRTALWDELAHERGFPVATSYGDALATVAPDGWVYVGQFCKEGWHGTGFDRCFAFWATTPDEVAPLREHLLDFEDDLPARTFLELNDWAVWQAAELAAEDG